MPLTPIVLSENAARIKAIQLLMFILLFFWIAAEHLSTWTVHNTRKSCDLSDPGCDSLAGRFEHPTLFPVASVPECINGCSSQINPLFHPEYTETKLPPAANTCCCFERTEPKNNLFRLKLKPTHFIRYSFRMASTYHYIPKHEETTLRSQRPHVFLPDSLKGISATVLII